MAGDAHPATALPDPGIREAAAMNIPFTVQRSLLVISPADNYGVTINVSLQRIIADDFNVLDGMFDAFKKLILVLQAARYRQM